MKNFALFLGTFTISAAAALLSGCGGSQPPIGEAVPHSADTLGHQHPATSSGSALLYLAGTRATYEWRVEVRTYPALNLVTTFDMPNGYYIGGMCSDNHGDIFITGYTPESAGGYIYEYAPGGTVPIVTLSDSGDDYYPAGCAVDPTTGNLAVGNLPASFYGSAGNVAVYQGASGSPALYTDSSFVTYNSPAYDNSGDLFILGNERYHYGFAELARGKTSLTDITVNGKIEGPTNIQWDGSDVAFLGGVHSGANAHPLISRVSVSGSTATIVGKAKLQGTTHFAGYGFSIVGSTVVTTVGGGAKNGWQLGLWNYPEGGRPKTVIHTGMDESDLSAVSMNSAL
jgi:hypothetical protein